MVWEVLLRSLYPEGKKFAICNEQDYLKWILYLSDTTCMPACCRFHLSEFVFGIIHRGGIKNQSADALSRLGTGEEDCTDISDDLHVATININKEIGEATKASPYMKFYIYDHVEQEIGIMMPDAQVLFQQKAQIGRIHRHRWRL